jgi:hypothetical protein
MDLNVWIIYVSLGLFGGLNGGEICAASTHIEQTNAVMHLFLNTDLHTLKAAHFLEGTANVRSFGITFTNLIQLLH